MHTTYVAYGLQLRSSFPLPGMTPSVAEMLPSLALGLATPEELDTAWSGPDGPPVWRGRLGDGCDLTIEQGRAGDLLFAYGDRARFRLDATKTTLDCAPSQDGLHWQQALIGKVLPSISVMRGYEALHAGVVDSPEGVVAIAGPSGSGKSTLAIELLRRGWLAGERWLAAQTTTKHPRPVRMVCLLERGPSLALETHTLPSNPLPLAPYMLGLSSDAERQRSRFCLYADLMESATLVRLTAGFEHRPEQLADLVEQALARRPELIAGGVA
jgi:hypothetical protein